MHGIVGGCHCGNISYAAEMPNVPSGYNPRACDCRFCVSHGALYVSDSKGSLIIRIRNESEVSKYRLGSKIADFLICKKCGVLTNVCYQEDGCLYGSINVRSAGDYSGFGDSRVAQLQELSDEERIERWKKYWFPNVEIVYEDA